MSEEKQTGISKCCWTEEQKRHKLPTNAQNKIISIANGANPTSEELKSFKPTPTHEAIAGALNDAECPHTLTGLAEHAGVSRNTLTAVIRQPAAVLWIVSQASRLAEARLGAVHARIYNMAMTSRSATWAKLYMERFDKEYKNQKVLEKGGAQQFNFLREMSHGELSTWFGRKLQELQGAATGGTLIPHEEVRGVPGSEGPKDELHADLVSAGSGRGGTDQDDSDRN
jgi:hypothetical protein